MTQVLVCIGAFALLTGAILGQTRERPTFPVADIREVNPSGLLTAQVGIIGASMTGPYIGGGLYRLRSGSMVELIAAAYGIAADKVTGGPAWIAFNRYDITAKVPPGATAATIKSMLQTLLADRFKVPIEVTTFRCNRAAGFEFRIYRSHP